MEYDQNEKDGVVCESPADFGIFNEKTNEISQFYKYGDELNETVRIVNNLQKPDPTDNQIEKTVNNDNNDTVS